MRLDVLNSLAHQHGLGIDIAHGVRGDVEETLSVSVIAVEAHAGKLQAAACEYRPSRLLNDIKGDNG